MQQPGILWPNLMKFQKKIILKKIVENYIFHFFFSNVPGRPAIAAFLTTQLKSEILLCDLAQLILYIYLAVSFSHYIIFLSLFPNGLCFLFIRKTSIFFSSILMLCLTRLQKDLYIDHGHFGIFGFFRIN